MVSHYENVSEEKRPFGVGNLATVEGMAQRKMRTAVSGILRSADPERLRLALRLLRSVLNFAGVSKARELQFLDWTEEKRRIVRGGSEKVTLGNRYSAIASEERISSKKGL